jgi:hypothetical protein
MIPIRLLKRRRREVKVDPHLVANGKRRRFPCLEVNGMFQAWWPMESEGKIPFHLFPLSPQPILLKPSIFLFNLKVLLTMVLSHYSRISFLSLIYKLRLCISM